ncbi:MAG: bacterioferritin [Thermoanaerobaculales bacterium]|jgi:bacterioferritin|nr:bacterioferritin [Thermoanaerobaculales bacterium]
MYEKSIELLNTAIADELAAIHQYMYFHFRLDDLGYTPLAVMLKQTAIEEMQHAEMIAERILFLKGEVELVVGREVEKIHDAQEMLRKADALEQEAIAMYNRFAVECAANADSGTKKLFEDLVAAEEGHWDAFDRQSDNVKRFGESYLALQSFQGDASGPAE